MRKKKNKKDIDLIDLNDRKIIGFLIIMTTLLCIMVIYKLIELNA